MPPQEANHNTNQSLRVGTRDEQVVRISGVFQVFSLNASDKLVVKVHQNEVGDRRTRWASLGKEGLGGFAVITGHQASSEGRYLPGRTQPAKSSGNHLLRDRRKEISDVESDQASMANMATRAVLCRASRNPAEQVFPCLQRANQKVVNPALNPLE